MPPTVVVPGLVAYAAFYAVIVHVDGSGAKFVLAGVGTGVYALLVAGLAWSRLSRTASAALVVTSGAVLQLVALTAGPRTSDDVYRYIWDGKVQLAGIDPYRYAPASPHLTRLRDGLLFGPASGCTHPFPGGCTVINRPTVHTVYPPVAQWIFDAVRILSFGGQGGARPFQVVAALGSTGLSVLLVKRALRTGSPLWTAAVWAWSPVVVSEFGNNAHIDWLACLLVFGALTLEAAGTVGGAGLAFGAAVLTKIYPGLLLPSLLRRRPALLVGAAVALGVLGYLPHVLAVGTGVIGYLPGYLSEEGYSSGSRLLLLGAILPHPFDTVVGALLLIVAAVVCARRAEATSPEVSAVAFVGVVLLVTTPRYGWYAAILVLLVAMSRRVEWLPVAAAPTFVYLVDSSDVPWVQQLIYLGAGLATAAGLLVRRRLTTGARPARQ